LSLRFAGQISLSFEQLLPFDAFLLWSDGWRRRILSMIRFVSNTLSSQIAADSAIG
jgi:hypothetical protein